MSSLISHASPAEIVFASGTIHVWTPTVLFNSDSAFRTFPYIIPAEVRPEINSLSTLTNVITVPRLLALKATTRLALLANDFSLVAYSCNCGITLWINTPKHVSIGINLSG
jgi:hypothetical protein